MNEAIQWDTSISVRVGGDRSSIRGDVASGVGERFGKSVAGERDVIVLACSWLEQDGLLDVTASFRLSGRTYEQVDAAAHEICMRALRSALAPLAEDTGWTFSVDAKPVQSTSAL